VVQAVYIKYHGFVAKLRYLFDKKKFTDVQVSWKEA
jgi:hypothetical protein